VTQGGTAMIIGWNPENATAGNSTKAALLSTMFNLKRGSSVLDRQGYPRDHLTLSGGLVKTPECGQILADVFDTPVTLLHSADEGCSWGAAVMAKYRHLVQGGYKENWETFLEGVEPKGRQRFDPNPAAVLVYQKMYERHTRLIELQPLLSQAVSR
jgi:sugar (pentulose or hexulose) kinase